MTGSLPETTPESLKLLMTADAVGGVWQYCVDLIGGLGDHGIKVLLATMGPHPSAERKDQLRRMPHVTLIESDYALEWMPNPWGDVDAAGAWLLGLADWFGADLIHLNGYTHGGLPWRKPVVIVAHSCVCSWWRAVHACAPGAEWNEYRRRVIVGLAAADRVIAPSRFMADALEQEYGSNREKIDVIPNFSRSSEFQGGEKQGFILAAGRFWDEAKNLKLLSQIAPHLSWPIGVAGSEPVSDAANAGKTIHLLGVLPYRDLLNQMDRASIFVHPALYEPFGLSVLEAARRRCCLVLSDIPSLRELWDGAALFIDPRKPELWISELARIIADARERQSLADRACTRATEFRASTAVAQYHAVYRALAQTGHREVAA